MKIVPPRLAAECEGEAYTEAFKCFENLDCPDYSLFNSGLLFMLLLMYFGLFWQVQSLKPKKKPEGDE